jgi:hypothetical protein
MAPQGRNANSPKSKSVSPLANSQSSFERVVVSLNLSPEEYESSPQLREWVLRNKDQKYVPPELLKALGLQVNVEP